VITCTILCLKVQNTAFVFGGTYNKTAHTFPHITIDLATLKTSDPESYLPDFEGYTSAVATDRDEIYILGGYSRTQVDVVIRMNASTQSYSLHQIENFPLTPGEDFIIPPTGVYIQKLNRIYYFGGCVFNFFVISILDLIWYVDLADI